VSVSVSVCVSVCVSLTSPSSSSFASLLTIVSPRYPFFPFFQVQHTEALTLVSDSVYDLVLTNSKLSTSCYELIAFLEAYMTEVFVRPEVSDFIRTFARTSAQDSSLPPGRRSPVPFAQQQSHQGSQPQPVVQPRSLPHLQPHQLKLQMRELDRRHAFQPVDGGSSEA
jgi:hypothetical protein